jgi:hypothetical protein
MPNPGIRINSTGAIGVYAVSCSTNTAANRATLTGATLTPLGTCDNMPQIQTGNMLSPVMSDWGGTAPIDYYHAGLVGNISFTLNRFSWTNVIPLVTADLQSSGSEALMGTTLFGRHGLRVGRDADNAFGLLFLYSGTTAQRPSADSGDTSQIVGKLFHSVGLNNFSIAQQGSRSFAVSLGFSPASSIISSNIEQFRDLTTVSPLVPSLSDFASHNVYGTGPVGIYGAIQNASPTWLPIGHCENFPQVSIGRKLDPVVNDLFGDAPFDYTYGGQTVDVQMDFSRYDQFNLDSIIRGNYTSNKGRMTLGTVGGLASTQGCQIRLWWPSTSKPSTGNALTFKYGHIENDSMSMAGSRAMKNAVNFKGSTAHETVSTTCQLVQFVFETAAGPTCGDFAAV